MVYKVVLSVGCFGYESIVPPTIPIKGNFPTKPPGTLPFSLIVSSISYAMLEELNG